MPFPWRGWQVTTSRLVRACLTGSCLLLSLLTLVVSEDGVALPVPGSLTLEADFLLGQHLEFDDADHDSNLLGLDKFSGLFL